jgi:hypothetical protein
VKNANLLLRFACEVAAVVGIVWWGWWWAGVVVGALVILLWGAFVAPRAAGRLPDPLRFGCELVIFAGATAAYVAVGRTVVAVVCAALALLTASLVRIWPEPA